MSRLKALQLFVSNFLLSVTWIWWSFEISRRKRH